MIEERAELHSRGFHVAIIAVFAAVMFVPWLDLFREAEASGPRTAELRVPAPEPGPVTSFEDLASYPTRFDEHFNDTFGFRDWFLRGHSIVKLFAFGVTPTPRVLIGKEGWLFFTGDFTVEDYRGLFPYTDDELMSWRRMLESRRTFLERRGIDYVVVIVPNKEELYPELMPDHLQPLGPRRIDQFVEYMGESEVDVLDLRQALTDARTDPRFETEPYLKLGTHWNGAGSYAAYEAIVEHLQPRHPELRVHPLDSMQRVVAAGNGDSWGRSMYVNDLISQHIVLYLPERSELKVLLENNEEAVFTCADAPRVRAMFFHDSFGQYNYRLLARSFARLHCHRTPNFPTERILEENPDVVIEQFVQRWLITKKPKRGPRPVVGEVEFDGLERELLSVSLPAGADGLSGVEGCVLEATDDGVRVRFDGKRDLLRLPDHAPGGGKAVLRLELTSPDDGRLRVFYAKEGSELPLRKESYRVPVSKGRSEVFVPLDDPRTTGRLFVRSVSRPDSIVLHAVEVRATDAR